MVSFSKSSILQVIIYLFVQWFLVSSNHSHIHTNSPELGVLVLSILLKKTLTEVKEPTSSIS